MDALTVGYTAIKPGAVGSFGDEWDFHLSTLQAQWLHHSQSDEADATTIIADYALGGGASAFAAMRSLSHTMTSTSQLLLNPTMVCPYPLASTWALVTKSTTTMTMCLKHKV